MAVLANVLWNVETKSLVVFPVQSQQFADVTQRDVAVELPQKFARVFVSYANVTRG